MGSTIIAAIAIAIIIAVVIGLSKFRARSEARDKADGNKFSPVSVSSDRQKQRNKRDVPAFNRLHNVIDSNWIQNFEDKQLGSPQYVQVAITDDLHAYWNESQKPENAFSNQNLAAAHLVFIKAIRSFINTVLQDTTFVRPGSNTSVINSKAKGYRKWSQDLDESYDREVKNITNKAKGIIITYKRYIQVARNESVYR